MGLGIFPVMELKKVEAVIPSGYLIMWASTGKTVKDILKGWKLREKLSIDMKGTMYGSCFLIEKL